MKKEKLKDLFNYLLNNLIFQILTDNGIEKDIGI